MAQNAASQTPSQPKASQDSISDIPDIAALRKSKDAEKMAAFVRDGFAKAKSARTTKQTQWYENLSFIFGRQWGTIQPGTAATQGLPFMKDTKSPYYRKQRTINRTRSFHRTEHSKFVQNFPTIVVVPSTSENSDVRSAYAGEQVWLSISEAQNLRRAYTDAAWWMAAAGTGYVKTQWDKEQLDKVSNQQGCITFGAVTPFHLFIPDLREPLLEDQPFVIQAALKPLSWVKARYGDAVKDIGATSSSASSVLDESYLDLSNSKSNQPDSVTVYEAWIKPGASPTMPQGGVVIMVEETVVAMTEGLPYDHQMYPWTMFSHMSTGTFYADAALRDVLPLQREYNEARTDISEASRRSGRPQILAPKGSIIAGKLTNEPGLIIEYLPGGPPPQWAPPPPLPEYVVGIPDRVLMDIEDIGGQHEVTKGSAPTGVTAGTAISYLGEKDSAYLTPQFQNIEDGVGNIARQTLQLFVQYVDVERALKTIGTDMSFDTIMLKGADIKNGTDVRVERGSAQGQSKAATDARLMDMWAMGIITDPQQMLRLLEVGGGQKILDIMNVAEKKAQRENQKMKSLNDQLIEQANAAYMEQMMGQLMGPEAPGLPGVVDDPMQATPGESPEAGTVNPADPMAGPPGLPPTPPVIRVDDFDIHEIHIEVHNKFRMGQEYEVLPDSVKEQFELHVKAHENAQMQKQLMSFLDAIPDDGSGGPAPTGDMSVSTGSPMGGPGGPPPAMGGATMSGNGQVPKATGGGESDG